MPAADAGRLTPAAAWPTIPAMETTVVLDPTARIETMLRTAPVIWLSSVRPDGRPHLVPIWFSWDGEAIIVASKPGAQKVRNIRSNATVMLALGEPLDDFDVGMVEGRAVLLDAPAPDALPAGHLAKYRYQMAAIGLGDEEFLATYSQVIRIVPTRYLPWHGRTLPASAGLVASRGSVDRRLAAAIRRAAATLAAREPRLGTAPA
jgi:PPOX class probable F420-dependent enzyme